MTDKINNGGPAFPVQTVLGPGMPGMSLRDWFAGQAVVAVMHLCYRDTLIPGESIETLFARKAYAIADAMLVAREKGGAE